jgi:hypothetical protein
MEWRCPVCGYMEEVSTDAFKSKRDNRAQCGFRSGPRLSDLKICRCDEPQWGEVKSQGNDPVKCNRCGGFVACEYCSKDGTHLHGFPIAFFILNQKRVCPDHVWRARAVNPPT